VLQLHEGNFFESEGIEEPYVGLGLALSILHAAKANWYRAIIATHAASAAARRAEIERRVICKH
jgi:hypothetical protein